MSRSPVFRSIIVPVDGSQLAEGAIPYALAIAERAHSKVRFVLVHPDQYPPLLIEPANVYLKELTQRFRERLGQSLSSIILNGPAAPSLVKHAKEIGADLVVMTTHGRGGLQRAWLGSVADELIRTSGVPVIVAHPSEGGSFPVLNLREIFVPLDGSPLSETALEPASALAELWDAEISLVQMVYPVPLVPDPALPFASGYDKELTAWERDAASDYVRDIAEGLRARGIKASGIALIGDKSVAHSLIELASPERVSLIVIATHGRGGLRRLVLGSVTDKLVRAAQVPIMIIPATRAPRRERRSSAGPLPERSWSMPSSTPSLHPGAGGRIEARGASDTDRAGHCRTFSR